MLRSQLRIRLDLVARHDNPKTCRCIANGCPSGDTITWEFTQGDLYGRGFEMWAIANGP